LTPIRIGKFAYLRYFTFRICAFDAGSNGLRGRSMSNK
jgi:hypothetical protein